MGLPIQNIILKSVPKVNLDDEGQIMVDARKIESYKNRPNGVP